MITTKKFQRRVEDFDCAACGYQVHGTGYTNHCPKCFVSKHVDNQPGDRAATCGGNMPVVQVFFQQGKWRLVQKCERCGEQKQNRVQPGDDMIYLSQLNERISRFHARG
ncbi:MAG: hypothetical protein ACD_43C00009G0004 [uncultured bacterium]|nr:MAG: hypothetical protein ACD_43C00009G0004 [uncultured bacterium]